jgi:hypothetical protein
MTTTITITVGHDLTEEQRDAVRLLLCDALGEFTAHREPPARYVATRYADHGEAFRASKLLEVERRCDLADILRSAASNLEVR